MNLIAKLATVASLAVAASTAQAALPVYPASGTENPVLYTFNAAATGDLVAYFAGSGAAYDETLGLLVNGIDTGIRGLQNHSTALGTSLDFGSVTAGDSLVFFIDVQTTGATWYSTETLNSDGANHVYAAAYAGGDYGIPAGTYVGFEDLAKTVSDFNYGDEQFVFTNVAAASNTPEPAAWALMLVGFGSVGAVMRRRPTTVSVSA